MMKTRHNRNKIMSTVTGSSISAKRSKRYLPNSKNPKRGSERYFMFGPNHILVTLTWDDGLSPGEENVCRCFLNRYKYT